MSSGSVKDFYHGKTILLTGATGFIGRLLLAKLMRLGNLKEILLVSRPKKGRSNDERLKKVLTGVLFDEMEKFDAKFESKLKIINGDMEIDGLQMSADDRDYIKDHVEIIIHGAATVRFDEQLNKAIAINIRGTKSILDIAVESKKLKSFVHISTAYSNCPRSEIDEIFYQPPMDYQRALQLLNLSEDNADAITAKLIAPWPNTYTFTKAISEDMIRQYQDRLPIAIIRPTVVASTVKDPFPGFADTILGVLGVGIGAGMGLIRVSKASCDESLDIIPADIVVNYSLVIAWYVSKTIESSRNEAQKKEDLGDKKNIFISCIGNIHWISNLDLNNRVIAFFEKYPLKKMMWLPRNTTTSSEFLFRFYFLLYHYVPAFFIDILLSLKGSKMRLMPIYSKIFFHVKLMSYFPGRSWKFYDDNKLEIFQKMTEKDHLDFPCRMDDQDLSSMHENAVIGIGKYFFKESPEDLIEARKKYKWLNILHYCFLAVVYSICFYVFYRVFGSYCIRMLPVIDRV